MAALREMKGYSQAPPLFPNLSTIGRGARSGTLGMRGSWQPNPQFYVDYQDCHYHGVEYMLCGGVARYPTSVGVIALGGLDLVDLRGGRLEHQAPVSLFIDEGFGPNGTLPLTSNAFWVEPNPDGLSLRFYFMTESDHQAELLTYDVTPWVNR